MFNNIFLFENRAVCEIMWKNIVEPDRSMMTIRSMRIASWITKATNTVGICNTYCCSMATMVVRTRLVVSYTACLVGYFVVSPAEFLQRQIRQVDNPE